MTNTYKCLPSTFLGIYDPYTAFCFNEACAYIIQQMEKGEEPSFKMKFNSFTDMYKHYQNG